MVSGMGKVWMRHQIHFNNSVPLYVGLTEFVLFRFVIDNDRGSDPRYHKINEGLAIAIEGTYVPAQAVIDQQQKERFRAYSTQTELSDTES